MGSESPNILVIVTDDQRLEGTMAVMPKTVGWFQTGDVPDREPVAGGTAYPNAVCTTPLCAPSRASILTGRYTHNHGVWSNEAEVHPDPAQMLPTQLRDTPPGYRTGIFGKYMNDWMRNHPAPVGPPGFERWSIFDGDQYFPLTVNEQGVQRTVFQYSTDYFADRAVDFLEETAGDGRPWFLYVAPATPHHPFIPDPKYANAPVPPFRAPPSYLEIDRRDKPPWVRWSFADPGYVESRRTAQLRMLRSADDLVHRLMTKIVELGQDSSTLAFYTADHGLHWGEHGLDAKASPYLESIRVPFYVRWPGRVEANRSDPGLVASIDVMPTVLDALGAEPGQDASALDGRSLLGGPPPRNRILIEYDAYRDASSPPAIRKYRKWASLLTLTFQYIETYEPGTEERIWHECYDLTRDPYELENLLHERDVESLAPIVELSRQLAADRACRGASCPPQPGDPPALEVDLAELRETGPRRHDTPTPVPPGQTRIRTPLVTRLPGTSVLFVVERADEPPPPAGFECSLDGEPFRRCGRRVTLRGLSNGPHSFRAAAIDEAGSRDPQPASYEWTAEALPSWSDTPDPGWPEITEGAAGEAVDARVVIADGRGGWYVGGSFTKVGGSSHANLVHINPDKSVDEQWRPSTNGTVKTLALSPERGTLYVGGAFTAVNGEGRGRLAALAAAGGELTPWSPELDGDVNELAISADSAYVVGAFSRVGGEARGKLAEIDLEDGAATAWDPGANPDATLLCLELTPERVYVGGAGLSSVGGASRENLAELDRATAAATSWNPSPDGDVEALQIGPDAETIFVGGRFEKIGAPARHQAHAAEIRLDAEGSATGWRPVPGYMQGAGGVPSVLDFDIADLTAGDERRWSIVIAGTFDTVRAWYSRNLVAEIAKFDELAGDGYPADWDPKLDSNAALAQPTATPSVFSAATSGPLIAVAGNFYASGFTPRRALAFYRKTG